MLRYSNYTKLDIVKVWISKLIAIVDYDIGNIGSVLNMLKHLGLKACLGSKEEDFENAEKIILPGNGAFDTCIQELRRSKLIPLLEHQIFDLKKPILGICVGAQIMGTGSEEGSEKGLGWLELECKRFKPYGGIKIPHMGWNEVDFEQDTNLLLSNLELDSRFYFVHSYYMSPKNESEVIMSAFHGEKFAAAVNKRNMWGVQFHPEKSHRFGKQLLSNFSGIM